MMTLAIHLHVVQMHNVQMAFVLVCQSITVTLTQAVDLNVS
jgi:hypothetical protein